MLKFLLSAATVIAISTSTVNAAEFVNQNGSEISDLCIAAVSSDDALNSVSRSEAQAISCNGMSIQKFVKKYRAPKAAPAVRVAFENKNNTNESELCIAAATSNEAYAQTKNRLFGASEAANVECNGKSLVRFAKRFNRAFNG